MSKNRAVSRLTQFIEVPPEVMVNVPRIEVVGHLQFRVENHKGLETYRPNRVVLRIPDGHLIVSGNDLVIGWIDRNEVLVTGHVRSLVFREGRT